MPKNNSQSSISLDNDVILAFIAQCKIRTRINLSLVIIRPSKTMLSLVGPCNVSRNAFNNKQKHDTTSKEQ